MVSVARHFYLFNQLKQDFSKNAYERALTIMPIIEDTKLYAKYNPAHIQLYELLDVPLDRQTPGMLS